MDIRRISILVPFAIATANATTTISPDHPSVRIFGRSIASSTGTIQWSWSGSGASITFSGTSCTVLLQAPGAIYGVFVDGKETAPLDLTNNTRTSFPLATGLPQGTHTVSIRQRTEANYSSTKFQGFQIEGVAGTAATASDRRIEFYGNSITCGYGILDSVASHPFSTATENESRTYAALAADSLGAERRTICWSGRGVLQNYGGDTTSPTLPKIFGRTMAADANSRWDFSLWAPQVVVVDLGTNDYSTASAQPDSARFHGAYLAFLDSLHAKYPNAKLVLLDGPMMSDGYSVGLNTLTKLRKHLDNLVAAMAKKGAAIAHFSLSQQGNLGYGADYHPNLAQAFLNGRELTGFLRTYMGWASSSIAGPAKAASRPEIVRSRQGLAIRIRGNNSCQARIVDGRGRSAWSRELAPGSLTFLPSAPSGRWLVLESGGTRQVIPMQPSLR